MTMVISHYLDHVELNFFLGEGWAQVEDITTRISNILKEYPEASYLSECVQNADDAGATEITLLLDLSIYNDTSILPKFREYHQTPALMIFNNSTFSEKDFQNIRNLGASLKKAELHTTGQFGLGLNSLYHITDVISIISQDHMLILDPCRKVLRDGGIRYPLSRCARYKDQLEPFKEFGYTPGKTFPGTVFRLPLR
jgi:sacsin